MPPLGLYLFFQESKSTLKRNDQRGSKPDSADGRASHVIKHNAAERQQEDSKLQPQVGSVHCDRDGTRIKGLVIYPCLVIGTVLVCIAALGLIAVPSMQWKHPSTLIMPFTGPAMLVGAQTSSNTDIDLSWHPPQKWSVNSLDLAINGTGTYGFIFNSSQTPAGTSPSTYNWCNMPHVHPDTYPAIDKSRYRDYQLIYAEAIHRHHKRSPYASNAFPVEVYPWDCSDARIFEYGNPFAPHAQPVNHSAQAFYNVDAVQPNPLKHSGFNGNCAFPQQTRGGLDDSWQHGSDLWDVYGARLGLLQRDASPQHFRIAVTNNVITSQVAGMLLNGMFGIDASYPVHVEPPDIAALEPTYSCPVAKAAYARYGVGSNAPSWTRHLEASQHLFQQLDIISGVDPSSTEWHQSWDHYFDNLSARLCHSKPLPCSATDQTLCVTQSMADAVFRLGELEYSFIYRDSPESLAASVASYGIWIAQLAAHLRQASSSSHKSPEMRYRHNVAHDGSMSRLLSILQLDKMVWPGMGAELVFELYRSPSRHFFVRILWGGQVLQSSSPVLGRAEMVPLSRLLQYFDGLVGVDGNLVPEKCGL